jgi:hypothetical protein
MSFTGDLEHLPIVDVIQLMNTSRKSGILSVKGKKGESQLVFKDGYIVSASHLNNSVRIGQILIDMGLISQEQLGAGLLKQQADGGSRKPLVITLIELGLVKEEDAYKGLQKLIEITLVEILTWKKGKFTLEALAHSIACEFRYYPEKMNHEVNLNTQSLLMDALRIFDEKVRDGLIEEDGGEEESPAGSGNDGFDDAFSELLSEDVLGLSEIDNISAQLPKAFTSVVPVDPVEAERLRIGELAPHLAAESLDAIALFLAKYAPPAADATTRNGVKGLLVLLGNDKLMGHALETVCSGTPLGVAMAETAKHAVEIISVAVASGQRPYLVIDPPETAVNGDRQAQAEEIFAMLRGTPPGIIPILLAAPACQHLTLQAYRSGARAVIPRPSANGNSPTFADDVIALLEIVPAYLQRC